jgi:hypothetical protein
MGGVARRMASASSSVEWIETMSPSSSLYVTCTLQQRTGRRGRAGRVSGAARKCVRAAGLVWRGAARRGGRARGGLARILVHVDAEHLADFLLEAGPGEALRVGDAAAADVLAVYDLEHGCHESRGCEVREDERRDEEAALRKAAGERLDVDWARASGMDGDLDRRPFLGAEFKKHPCVAPK